MVDRESYHSEPYKHNSTCSKPDKRCFHNRNDTAAEHTVSINVTSVVPSSENVPSRLSDV